MSIATYTGWPPHARPPQDRRANLIWRATQKLKTDASPSRQLATKELCRRSWRFFFDGFLWTFDPRPEAKPHHAPFILYEYQVELVEQLEEALHKGQDILVEKSRDMGATWVILGWVLWHWLFDKAFKAHLGSRKEEFVDKAGDTSSHFEILRYMLRRLPKWMLPQGFDKRHRDAHMRLINPAASGSAVTGEATNPDFSRQGRYTVVFLDEFASVACDEQVLTATGESTNCRLMVSTPKGIGNVFHRERHSGRPSVVTLHWQKHPRKRNTTPEYLLEAIQEGRASSDQTNVPEGCYRGADGKIRSPWYDEQCAKKTPLAIAQELDIDYLGSGLAVLDLTKIREFERIIEREEQRGTRVVRYERDGDLEVYAEPVPGKSYVASVDTAKGNGGDFSTVELWDLETLEQVAELQAQMPPDLLGPYAVALARRYNDALLVIENTGMGLATCYAARDAGYSNLYLHRPFDDPHGEGRDLGLSNGPSVRPHLIRLLCEAVRDGKLRPHSLRWIAECYVLETSKTGKVEARAGYHDDLVMATAFILYAARSVVVGWSSAEPLPVCWG